MGFLAAAIAVGLIDRGRNCGEFCWSAAMGAMAERSALAARALIFVGSAEGIAIYGLIIAIMILENLMRTVVIADEDTVLGFSLAGVQGMVVETENDIRALRRWYNERMLHFAHHRTSSRRYPGNSGSLDYWRRMPASWLKFSDSRDHYQDDVRRMNS